MDLSFLRASADHVELSPPRTDDALYCLVMAAFICLLILCFVCVRVCEGMRECVRL